MIAEKQNAHSGAILSVNFNNDGSQIVSGSSDKTIKVWGEPLVRSICRSHTCRLHGSLPRLTNPSLSTAGAESLAMIEERRGDAATIDKSGEVAERNGATLRLKEGGTFYAPSPLSSVAVHWPRLVAGSPSGELYHLEVQD